MELVWPQRVELGGYLLGTNALPRISPKEASQLFLKYYDGQINVKTNVPKKACKILLLREIRKETKGDHFIKSLLLHQECLAPSPLLSAQGYGCGCHHHLVESQQTHSKHSNRLTLENKR